MSSIGQNAELYEVPALVNGAVFGVIVDGSLSLAFMGFAGLLSAT